MPSVVKLILVTDDYPVDVDAHKNSSAKRPEEYDLFDNSSVVVGMMADKPSAAEPMYNIDNRLSEPLFDAEKLSAVMHDDYTDGINCLQLYL
jgi:hypothetical protein